MCVGFEVGKKLMFSHRLFQELKEDDSSRRAVSIGEVTGEVGEAGRDQPGRAKCWILWQRVWILFFLM